MVPPGSTDRFIAPPNQNYMNALVTIQTSLEAIANQPGAPTDAAAAQTVNNATQAKVNTRQMAQAFRIDAEGHIETNVQKLLEDPITYLDAMLTLRRYAGDSTPAASRCAADFRPVLSKYPFNPDATSEATLADVNALFRKPDGLLWTFFDQKLQKVLVAPGHAVRAQPHFQSDGEPGVPQFLQCSRRLRRNASTPMARRTRTFRTP